MDSLCESVESFNDLELGAPQLSTKHVVLRVPSSDSDHDGPLSVCFHGDDHQSVFIGSASGRLYHVTIPDFKCRCVCAPFGAAVTCCAYVSSISAEVCCGSGQRSGHVLVGLADGSVSRLCAGGCGGRVSSVPGAHSGGIPVLGLCTVSKNVVCSWTEHDTILWRLGSGLEALQRLEAPGLLQVTVFSSRLWAVFATGRVLSWQLEPSGVLCGSGRSCRPADGKAWRTATVVSDGTTTAAVLLGVCGKQVLRVSLAGDCRENVTSLPSSTVATALISSHTWPRLVFCQSDGGMMTVLDIVSGRILDRWGRSRSHSSSARVIVSPDGSLMAWPAKGAICLHRLSRPHPFFRPLCPELNSLLRQKRLLPSLRRLGSFPDAHRVLIWRSLLRLPGSKRHWQRACLNRAGSDGRIDWREHLDSLLPANEIRVKGVCSHVLSVLIDWSSELERAEFLPRFVIPFCRSFAHDRIFCCDLLSAVLQYWCADWLLLAPFPPVHILGRVERLLVRHCASLLHHLGALGVTPHIYGWQLLASAFGEVLEPRDWMQLWDHVLLQDRYFLLAVTAAYSVALSRKLLQMNCPRLIADFYRQRGVVNVSELIRWAYIIDEQMERSPGEKGYSAPEWGKPGRFVSAPVLCTSDSHPLSSGLDS